MKSSGETTFQPDQGRRAGWSRADTRLSRLATALAAVTVALLASAAAIPAAFARELPPGLYRRSSAALAPSATVQHTATTGGITGWQIALIGVGVPLAAVVLTIVLRRVRGARQGTHSPTA
jgi:hypothetical protein